MFELVYVTAATAIFFFLALIWRLSDMFNVFMKIVFVIMTILGVGVTSNLFANI